MFIIILAILIVVFHRGLYPYSSEEKINGEKKLLNHFHEPDFFKKYM